MKLIHKPVSLQPRGLINKGNWCYINAVSFHSAFCCPCTLQHSVNTCIFWLWVTDLALILIISPIAQRTNAVKSLESWCVSTLAEWVSALPRHVIMLSMSGVPLWIMIWLSKTRNKYFETYILWATKQTQGFSNDNVFIHWYQITHHSSLSYTL